MILTLKIENYDMLENGGPVQITLDRRGASVGRRAAMDWVLPDSSRHISGHHFDIGLVDGAFWLTDVSTNGTFLQGQARRIARPHLLEHGERLVVGHYIIHVEIKESLENTSTIPPVSTAWDDDLWSFSGECLPPVDPLPLPVSGTGRLDDVVNEFVPLSWGPPEPATPVPVPPAVPAPVQAQPEVAAVRQDNDGFVQAFCAGAGLDPALAQSADGAVLAESLGRAMRVITEDLMRMLHDRAHVKQFTRLGMRTMRAASDSNPMKFLPNADQAITAMFLYPRAGFMIGTDALSNTLTDLRQHQMAVFAALQPALTEVLADLSPEEVEAATKEGGNILPGLRKSRAWELFVERWKAKTHAGEHGMLDVFLQAFARSYAEASWGSEHDERNR